MHSFSIPKPSADRPQELRISIAIGATLIVQTALALIWAGSSSERLAQLERRTDNNAAMIERTARLEEQVRFMSVTLVRIERKIDQSKEVGQ
ncbi:MAG: hypothetical protein DHS20C05_25130 [Hyphococcus sp.]|nr:MAG: hypothetical protein DHS20C05_25130 [Marinicaulis sp.]